MFKWTRSSFCNPGGCIEVLEEPQIVMIRDSDAPEEIIYSSKQQWKGFIQGVKSGDFDDL